uniref:Uncharacterized protein n=1 Tax=Anopheles minimus TaxID=112268 RepID=A0A182VXZ6_9DIPT
MIHILNFIAGMNNPLECKHEAGEPRGRTITPEYCFDTMDSHCVHCGNTTEYSVKSLRNLFLGNSTQEAMPRLNSASRNIERLPECQCTEHTEEDRFPEKKPPNDRVIETRSVQELKHLFEMKMKINGQESSNSSARTNSRPVSGKTYDGQDTISLDPPHPEGQFCMYGEPPVRSKPCTRWSITNTSIVEIPNGMQITCTVLNDSKH